MKKWVLLFLLAAPLLVFAKGGAIINGKIIMQGETAVNLRLMGSASGKSSSFNYDIPVNTDGSFHLETDITEPVFATFVVGLGEGRSQSSFFCPVYIKAGEKADIAITIGGNTCLFSSNNRNLGALADYSNYNMKAVRGIYVDFANIEDPGEYLRELYSKADEAVRIHKPDKEVEVYLRAWGYVEYLSNLYDFAGIYQQMTGKAFNAPAGFYDLIGNPGELLDRKELLAMRGGIRCVDSYITRKATSPEPEVKLRILGNEFKNQVVVDALAEFILEAYMSESDYKGGGGKEADRLKSMVGVISDPEKRASLLNDFENKRYRQIGAPYPGIVFLDREGKQVTLDSFKGKYVYLDIWASWCAPCCAEVPSLKKLEEEYGDIAFVSISIDSSKDRWMEKMKELGMEGFMLLDKAGDIVKVMGVKGIPHFLIYGPDGKLYNNRAPRPSSIDVRLLLDKLE